MMTGTQYTQERSVKTAERRLKEAVTFATLNIKNPMFQKRMGKGNAAVLVRLEWPGVLTVIDPSTGIVLAVSEVGQPEVLQARFQPPITCTI